MEKFKEFHNNHRQGIALVIGYLAVACISFWLGNLTATDAISSVKIQPEQSKASLTNYTPNPPSIQSESLNCEGKIKGSSSLIYHMPDGSFYKRVTKPVRCFDTEEQAKAAGFRKSSS